MTMIAVQPTIITICSSLFQRFHITPISNLSSVTKIEKEAFFRCEFLKKVSISNSIKTIEERMLNLLCKT